MSSTTVATTYQMDGLKDHIRSMEDEKFIRLEQFVKLKESILNLYDELESEPSSELERLHIYLQGFCILISDFAGRWLVRRQIGLS